ncbi:bacitracin transport system permease protein [Filibacter limicola]|uniref:Bacitracin transport system permease protein n=1 Tax=Sporosarcina limicola TaxID=34101 RepID=A0A927MID9_9BACL|nr:ABC transporter permease [Sporosarcina limicola]MBE1555230.1 bacitracin transport system permease protein [Sporosarcina limicola]
MTLFDLVVRSMRKNIKHYYLYFFALIFSVVLYFVFSTLEQDSAVLDRSGGSMGLAFKVAGILLILIAGIFVVYANAIFLKRRSREIGLYQLIGLSKNKVARLLIIENVLLSAGALIIGIGAGMLVSRLFLLLLMKLIGHEGFITVSFSLAAIIQTIIVFMVISTLTSIQMLFTVRRSTLLGLFNAEKKGEQPKKPRTFRSAVLALLGIGLIVFGYWLSGNMMNKWLLFNMLAVLASTILGTYLVFRVTISWLFYQIRSRKQGHLGLNNSLSLGSLMHRMKGNANSLTIITVLSAMTLTMLAGAYSLYYATEKVTRYVMPYDFMFDEDQQDEEWMERYGFNEVSVEEFEAGLKEKGIAYTTETIELLGVEGTYEKGVFPILIGKMEGIYNTYMVSAKQLQKAGFQVETPKSGTLLLHYAQWGSMLKDIKVPFEVNVTSIEPASAFTAVKYGAGDVVNASWGPQFVVNDADFEKYKSAMDQENMLNISEERVVRNVRVFNVADKGQLAIASGIRNQNRSEGSWSHGIDYYSMYEDSIKVNGLLIFIAGFLGLVFLISTGSILYFKQMTEAEQEKQSYATLRQLGFTVKDIMRGIIRKQVFVFGLPLLIGLLHSIFAIKSASFIFMSDITVPTAIAMGVYALIYLTFAFLTIGYYRKTVKAAL